MKKMFALLLIISYLLATSQSFAQTPTTASSDNVPTADVINQLKERIASRVAQLKLVERRGIIGVVSASSNTQITLTDVQGNTRFIDVDEITKFTSFKNTDSFGISDITKGTTVSVLGLYNKESRRTLARFVNVVTIPQFIHSTILSIDKENYTVTIVTRDQKQMDVDIENTTKTYSYTKDADLIKSGFSKLNPGEKTIVVGTPDVKNKNNTIGLRLIHFPEIQEDIQPSPTKQETSPPSTRSGEKKETK